MKLRTTYTPRQPTATKQSTSTPRTSREAAAEELLALVTGLINRAQAKGLIAEVLDLRKTGRPLKRTPEETAAKIAGYEDWKRGLAEERGVLPDRIQDKHIAEAIARYELVGQPEHKIIARARVHQSTIKYLKRLKRIGISGN